jgi:predicted nucleic acid-binding protein
MPSRVFVDSNVLASRTLRDWLFLLRNAVPGMFELYSSLDVLAETVRVVRRRSPEAGGDLTANLTDLLQDNLNHVLTRYPPAIGFPGGDRDDQHVHAAAISCDAVYLLTDNPADFGEPDVLPYELYTADEFLCLVDDGASNHVLGVTRAQNQYWQNRRAAGQQIKPLDAALLDAGCPDFARRVQGHLRTLAGPTVAPLSTSSRAQRRQRKL